MIWNGVSSSRERNEPQHEVEQLLAAFHQELETVRAARDERDETLSPFSGLQKVTKAANGADLVIQESRK